MNSASSALASRSAICYHNLLHLPSPTDASNAVVMVMKSNERKFSAPVKKGKSTTIPIIKKFIVLLNKDQIKNTKVRH